MAQKEEPNKEHRPITHAPLQGKETSSRRYLISNKVTDHLANERTFLAWIRTGLAIIGFGFVVERFGILLRELGFKTNPAPIFNSHYSSIIGITLILLGILVMIVAILNFLQTRRNIDKETFHPHAGFAILLTVITCFIGLILAIYLYFTA